MRKKLLNAILLICLFASGLFTLSACKDDSTVNDPNKWAEETNNERYILTLLLSVINVSCKTVDIVSKLPKLTF